MYALIRIIALKVDTEGCTGLGYEKYSQGRSWNIAQQGPEGLKQIQKCVQMGVAAKKISQIVEFKESTMRCKLTGC